MGDAFAGDRWIDWGVASRALPGEVESGDGHVFVRAGTGALAGVVDGLGHGAEAARVAQVAVTTLRASPAEPVVSLVERCHRALMSTRGVVLSLAAIGRSGRMTWVGVGNVEGVLIRADGGGCRAREWLSSRGGVVGYQLPRLRPSDLQLRSGDVLVLASDGIRRGFVDAVQGGEPAQRMADDILGAYAKSGDDALALVVHFGGGSA